MKKYLLLAASVALLATAAPASTYVSFLACPVARDLGPEQDLCFFTEHGGIKYGLVAERDSNSPELKHQILVEGRVLPDEPAYCGGLRVQGSISVMPEIDTRCDQIVPASSDILPPPPDPGLQERIMAGLRALEADPAASLIPLRTNNPPYPVIEGEAGIETYYMRFEGDRLTGPDAMRLVSMAKLPGVRVDVSATRGATLLDDGRILTEKEGMARRRATKMAEILVGLGVPATSVRTSYSEQLPDPTGRDDWMTRRVDFRWSIAR